MKADAGDLPSPAPSSDGDLAAAVARFTQAKRAPRTRQEYEKHLRDFFVWSGIGTLAALLELVPERIVVYRNDLQARGLAASTINARIAALRGLLSRLLAEGRMTRNPADPALIDRGLPVSDMSRTEGLSPEEISAIIATCDGTLRGLRDRALLMMLYYEGLRRSEAAKLRYRDLATKRGLLIVRDAKGKDYAEVRLKPEVKRAVDDYLEVLSRELRRMETRAEDPVFCSLADGYFGKGLTGKSINEIVKSRVKAAGIRRRVTAHGMRHSCTTHALTGGAPLHQVQRHLRHKDVRTTLRYDREREVRGNPTLEALPEVM